MSVRILLVDDHVMFRAGLRALLQMEPGMEVVGEAGDGWAAAELARELEPDVIVMDIRMPGLNGVDATRHCLEAHKNAKVIALSGQYDERSTTEMLRAGAAGYLVKNSAASELTAAIAAVMAGHTYLSPSVTEGVVRQSLTAPPAGDGAFHTLSPREREVLQLTAEGLSAKAIARRLHVSVKTIETHRRNVMAKTGSDSVADLTRYAIREGIATL